MSNRYFGFRNESYWRFQVRRGREAGTSNLSLRWLRHPLAWTEWRADVRRKGPLAPDFNEWLQIRSRGQGAEGSDPLRPD